MLFQLYNIPNHGIYELHDDVLRFFYNSITRTRYNTNELFTVRLRNVIANATDLNSLFRRVFRELNLNGIDKLAVYNEIIQCNQVENILSDRDYAAQYLQGDQYASLNTAISALYGHLWRSTIKTVSCATNYGSIEDHYTQFVTLNRPVTRRICAFCGLKRLEDPKEKVNAYDHYLNQTDYPLLRINFKNLIPMCDTCNQRPNKGTVDMVFDNANARRVAFYPFNQVSEVCVAITSNGIDNFSRWSARVTYQIPNDEYNTWKTVFNIDSRYTNYLTDSLESWILNLGQFILQGGFPNNVTELIAKINEWRAFRINCARDVGDFIESSFLLSLTMLPDGELGILHQLLRERTQLLTH